ncbi:MAG TPA: SpoIIE family protein phosphatase, partial [Acidimicrobiales bacterium]|nr:SpoIIE family protein phosphatase [Acidimicrobiales bacterium]
MSVSHSEQRAAWRWPAPRLQALLDGLSDGVIATDMSGRIVYANASAEQLLDWPTGELLGTHVSELFPPRLQDWLGDDFPTFVADRLPSLAGIRHEGTLVRHSGAELPVEVMVDEAPAGGGTSVVVGLIRQRRVERLKRWNDLNQRLFDTLAEVETGRLEQTVGQVGRVEQVELEQEERLLAVLGTELAWDATTLWSIDPDGDLVHRAIWTNPSLDREHRLRHARPLRASAGATLPLQALRSGQPFWISDLQADPRFATGPAAGAGLRGAVVFPVRVGGDVVGVVELLSSTPRPADPELVELVDAVSGPVGELLAALARAGERERLLSELEQARRDQTFLLEACRVMAEAADYRETMRRLARLAVPTLADLCIIDVLDETGRFRRLACEHHDPTVASLVRELERDFPPDPQGVHPSIDVVRHGRSRWSPEVSDTFLRQTTRNQRHFEVVKALGFTSYITVPLSAQGQTIGSLTLISAGSGRVFEERDVASAEQLAVQVGSAVGRARRHEREHLIAHTLQQSLLPDQLPVVPELDLAARYEPASEGTEVGGDWYDVVELGDRVALVVGDVEGHDMRAAGVMAKLRHGLSAILSETPSATEALDRLDRFASTTGTARMATVLIAVIDPSTGDVSVAAAGHPPPVLVDGGRVSLADLDVAPPIGVQLGNGPRHESKFRLDDGSLLLYTDGLIEHHDQDVTAGLARLVTTVAGTPWQLTSGALCDHVITNMIDAGHQRDDVVL